MIPPHVLIISSKFCMALNSLPSDLLVRICLASPDAMVHICHPEAVWEMERIESSGNCLCRTSWSTQHGSTHKRDHALARWKVRTNSWAPVWVGAVCKPECRLHYNEPKLPPSNPVATSHIHLKKIEYNKIKNLDLQLYQSHFKCLIVLAHS